MSFSRWIVGSGLVGAVGTGLLATACGSSSATTTSGGAGANCDLTAACTSVKSDCVALVDNSGTKSFLLRMNQLTVTKPAVLAASVPGGPPNFVGDLVSNSVLPNLSACNLGGQATFNWLLEFTISGTTATLKTGGAVPIPDEHTGYCFDTGTTTQGGKMFTIAPAVLTGTLSTAGVFSATKAQDLTVPIFLDAMGKSVVILPLHQALIHDTTLSADNNCVGKYNAAGLDPTNSCAPSASMPAFIDGGTLDGFITLEDADTVPITNLKESLCVLLTGDPNATGTPSVCSRDKNKKIIPKGDWCSTTNSAATASCYDAYALSGTFSAGSVKLGAGCK